jgi:transposase
MERRKFTREFKLEAVRLIKERGVSYAQASHDLSVHQSQLRGWVKALADDRQHAFPGQGQMKPEQLEIAQLKREVIRLKAERDILKKAAVDSTGERNIIDFTFSLEDSRWRKWVGPACLCSRRKISGNGGRRDIRSAILVALSASTQHPFLGCCCPRAG